MKAAVLAIFVHSGIAGRHMRGDTPSDAANLRRLATRIRMRATDMVAIEGFGYLGQAMSSAEIFAVLFGGAMRIGHDRFVLSKPAGRVGIHWSVEGGRRLRLTWKESGGPDVAPPAHQGFGTRAIKRMIEQLDGEITSDWQREGARCDIAIAL